jgi:outer membrane protein assembly factor BamB
MNRRVALSSVLLSVLVFSGRLSIGAGIRLQAEDPIPGGLATAPWPVFRGGPRNSGCTAVRNQMPTKPWIFEPDPPDGYGFYGSPSTDSMGIIYIGSGSVYALDGTTGKKKWEFYAGNAGFFGCPTIDAGGTLYSESYDGHIYAIETATGKMKWAYEMESSPGSLGGGSSSAALGANGLLYVGSSNKRLYAIKMSTGKLQWSVRTTAPFYYSSPTVGVDGAVYCSSGGIAYAFDGATGKKRWSYAPEPSRAWDLGGSPAIGPDGRVYFSLSFHDEKHSIGMIAALDSATGAVRWTFHTDAEIYSSPAVGDDGSLYIGCGDNNVYCLDTAKGAVKWKFATNGKVESSPAIGVDGTIYVGSHDGKMYALDGATGMQKWAFQTEKGIHCSPLVSPDGTVYFGSLDNRFYAIKDGKSVE